MIQRSAVAGFALAGAAVAFLIVSAGQVTLPVYLPVEGRWTLDPAGARGPAMDWFARAGVAWLAGLLAGALAHVTRRGWSRWASASAVRGLLATAFLLTGWCWCFVVLRLLARR